MRWGPFAVRKNKLHPLATLQQLELISSWNVGLVDIHCTENRGENLLLGLAARQVSKPDRVGLLACLLLHCPLLDLHDARDWLTRVHGHGHCVFTRRRRNGWSTDVRHRGPWHGTMHPRSHARAAPHCWHVNAVRLCRRSARGPDTSSSAPERRPARHTGRGLAVHRPHVHRDCPVRLDDLVPDLRENDLPVWPEQIVVAGLDVRSDDIDVKEGLLDELLHTLVAMSAVSRGYEVGARCLLPRSGTGGKES